MPKSSSTQFSLKINTKALLTLVFIMDNYLTMNPGSTTAKNPLNLLSGLIFTTFCGTIVHKATLKEQKQGNTREMTSTSAMSLF